MSAGRAIGLVEDGVWRQFVATGEIRMLQSEDAYGKPITVIQELWLSGPAWGGLQPVERWRNVTTLRVERDELDKLEREGAWDDDSAPPPT